MDHVDHVEHFENYVDDDVDDAVDDADEHIGNYANYAVGHIEKYVDDAVDDVEDDVEDGLFQELSRWLTRTLQCLHSSATSCLMIIFVMEMMRRWRYVDVMMIVIMRTIMSKISRLALLSKAKIAKFNTPHQDLSIGFICVPGSSPDFFLFWLNHISSPTPVVFQARQMHDDPSEQYTDTCSIVHLYRIQLERTVELFLSPTFILRSV